MKVILYNPQIPQNTGNIVRTCRITGSDLILVPPLGFNISHSKCQRAGLDYWDMVDIKYITNISSYLQSLKSNFYFFSSKSEYIYSEIDYQFEDTLIFGSETSGLPAYLKREWPDHFYTIPMLDTNRCLNLSNSVAIILYEAWRQLGFNTSRSQTIDCSNSSQK
ncbi:MAG: tRNA (cytidine(34)-2'-O)-methyltransferase [Chlamydiales bacterium]